MLDKVHSHNFQTFWYWMNERQQIFLRKESGEPFPWTRDKFLQQYGFCNVFREQDTVTKQFARMFREPYSEHPNLWFAYCLARQINWPDTVQEIMEQTGFPEVWEPEQVCSVMRERQLRGDKLYTGAYMIRGDIQKHGINEDNSKPKYTVFKVLDPVWKRVQDPTWRHTMESAYQKTGWPFDTIEGTVNFLESFHGWAGFLSYEVATDLRHTRYLRNAPDIMTWANPGPGAKRGLNRLFGRPTDKALGRQQALDEMRWLLEVSKNHLASWMPRLEMRDIEHSLCETDKYLRLHYGEGRPRSKYKPKTKETT